MKRFLTLFSLILLVSGGPTPAQESAFRDELRFAEVLRDRGDYDLARDYLKRLAANAPAELAKELPLEYAKTSLRLASEEPEAARRMALYQEARDSFKKFIDANPGHPRNAEANLDIARVLNMLGKTELNRALLSDEIKTRKETANQAFVTLQAAATQLVAAGKDVEAQLARLPDPESINDKVEKKAAEAARFPVENEVKQTEYERGLNFYDQATSFIIRGEDLKASEILDRQSKPLLANLAQGDPKYPITWKARSWLGRVYFETDSADKARSKYQEVIDASSTPSAAEGVRLARYFRLLAIRDKPTNDDNKKGVNGIIIEASERWRKEYPRFLTSAEGCGLTFLLGETYLKEAAVQKAKKAAPKVVDALGDKAIALFRELERSENEFTERARRKKLEALVGLGKFNVKIETLKSFDDCYVRAQYEAFQMNQEAKDGKSTEEKRKERINNIVTLLSAGLADKAVQNVKPTLDLNNARAMLAYWALHTGKLDDAIRQGESFAVNNPESSQAEMAAVYALQAYTQLLDKKKFEEGADDLRTRMFNLARRMEDNWPTGLGGQMARHSVGLQLIREENYAEAIKKLSSISSSYGSYPLVCFQIADACFKAENGKIEPINGDRPGDYRKRALLALENLPLAGLGPDPFANHFIIGGKAMLGRELFKFKRFQQMDDLASNLLEQVTKVKFSDDEDKHRTALTQLRFELVDIKLFARYGLADAAFQANDFAKVVELTDPLVDAVDKGGDDSQEKTNLQKNQQLGTALLMLALRSNIQLAKIDRTEVVLGVLDKIGNEGGDGLSIMRLLAFLIKGQIEELRKKNDKGALAKAVKGYSDILDKRVKKQANPNMEFIRILSDCYSNMDRHTEAAAELAKVQPPAMGSPDEKTYRVVQLALVRELRLSKTPENVKKARAIMDEIMGSPQTKPGWGARDLLALKEQGQVLQAEEKYAEAFSLWASLVKRLAPQVNKGGAIKEHFLECNFYQIYCYVKISLTKPGLEEREKQLKSAAQQIVQLESNWGADFGSDASKQRFADLFAQEPAVKAQYDELKKK